MNGKIVFITGGNSGIGKATAKGLAEMGAHIIIMSRNEAKGKAAVEEIKQVAKADVELIVGDLAKLSDVRRIAKDFNEKYDRLDVLINNAGMMCNEFGKTEDGFERQVGVNHLGHFLLTYLLEPTWIKTENARIVNVSSDLHLQAKIDFKSFINPPEGDYSPFGAYGQSKLCNVMFTILLAQKLNNKNNITVNALHPGVVGTSFAEKETSSMLKFFWKLGKPFFKSPAKGAATSIYLASSPEVANVTGKYFKNKKQKQPSMVTLDKETMENFWTYSERLVGIS
jgi:NAD(P)-dependent dehydrogenase (short-subunit alcohol dehydrogenase family)